jgi:SAM-dependent methyltransferase
MSTDVSSRVASDERATAVARSFGYQWAVQGGPLGEGDTRYGLSRAEEVTAFLDALGLRPRDLAGRRVLDAGCGDGFLVEAISPLAGEVVGVDLSESAGLAARRCRALNNVRVLRGNVLALPFAPASFDVVWCEGVLVHTTDPRGGFRALGRLVRPGGRLYVWLYPVSPRSVYQRVRDLLPGAHRLPHGALLALCYLLAGPVFALQEVLRTRARREGYRTIALALFDNLAPRIQTRHTVAEIREWFAAEGFGDLRETGAVGISGTRIA